MKNDLATSITIFILGMVTAGIIMIAETTPDRVVREKYVPWTRVDSIFKARLDTIPRLGQSYKEVKASWCKDIDSVASFHLSPVMPGYACPSRSLLVLGGLVNKRAEVIGVIRWEGPLPQD